MWVLRLGSLLNWLAIVHMDFIMVTVMSFIESLRFIKPGHSWMLLLQNSAHHSHKNYQINPHQIHKLKFIPLNCHRPAIISIMTYWFRLEDIIVHISINQSILPTLIPEENVMRKIKLFLSFWPQSWQFSHKHKSSYICFCSWFSACSANLTNCIDCSCNVIIV